MLHARVEVGDCDGDVVGLDEGLTDGLPVGLVEPPFLDGLKVGTVGEVVGVFVLSQQRK